MSTIKLMQFRDTLKSGYLLPSRLSVRDNVDEYFQTFDELGIKNLSELQKLLKNKKKISECSIQTKIPEEYLLILSREINSLVSKPRKLSDFFTIEPKTTEKLEKLGIKTTLQFYEKALTKVDQNNLSQSSGISITEIRKILSLSNLTRLRWVNHTFATILYEIGLDSIEKVAKADYHQLQTRIKEFNEEKGFSRGILAQMT